VRQQDAHLANAGGAVTTIYIYVQRQHLCRWLHASIYSVSQKTGPLLLGLIWH